VAKSADTLMAEADPWAAFNPEVPQAATGMPPANAPDPWAAFNPQAEKAEIPRSFINRLSAGIGLGSILEGAKEGFGGAPVGLSNDSVRQLMDLGVFHGDKPPTKWQLLAETGLSTASAAIDLTMRGVNSALYAGGAAVGNLIDDLGGNGEKAKNEAINLGNFLMIEGGMGRFVRPRIAQTGQPVPEQIGSLPTTADFKASAQVLAQGQPIEAAIEQNLQRLWQEKGIHPAEAVNDAQRDAFLKQELTSETNDNGEPLRAVGAEVTKDTPTPAEQPVPPAGSLTTSIKAGLDKLYDVGRDLQMLTTPMAAGTEESMAIAKDFANAMRRNRWEWSRVDDDIAKRFDREQRERMWNAADEESVIRQEMKEKPEQLAAAQEHMGLATLTAEERQAVESLQNRAQVAWLRARDIGMVEGEGLPSYAPRMVINAVNATTGDRALPLNGLGRNLRVTTAQMKHRQYLTAEETEAAAKGALGEGAEIVRDIRTLPLATAKLEDAIAGRTLINNIKEVGKRSGDDTVIEGGKPSRSEHEWFTIDHPAFRTWRPKFETVDKGTAEEKTVAVKNEDGDIVFQQVPIYVRGDFEGPLRAVLSQKSGAFYNAAMNMKGKTMSLIMNSPLIHNAVEWGRALPAMPGKVATFKVYFDGNAAKNNPAVMREAIDAGLVPIGHRFFNQDISSIMEEPNLTPGRSWTAKLLGAIPGLFDKEAGDAVKTAIDKAGDFWHNTLLWDRIGDLQMGLYSNFKEELLQKGVDNQTAARAAAHWANRYAGALPREAMSDNARKIANFLFFSRSFTLGNVGAMKDMLTGLPRDVMAQVSRDVGNLDPEAAGYIKSIAVRRAVAVVLTDMGLMYVGNSLLQSGMNVLAGNSSLDQEMHGYAQRFAQALTKMDEHPLSLLQPFKFLESLSATASNEPGKENRMLVGYAKDGTAIYARNPVGKIGEEFTGWLTNPLDMFTKKLGTIVRPAWQILANDKGFGRKVYDPNADTPAKYLRNIGNIAAHLAESQIPEGQIGAVHDLITGENDAKIAALQAFGPISGVTFSKGAPGGPAVGELYSGREKHDYEVYAAMPDIRKQIQHGDVMSARAAMQGLGIPKGLQDFYVRTTLNPATRLGGRTLRDFYLYSTPEQRQRLENARTLQLQQQ
jgi:hypothetical protein